MEHLCVPIEESKRGRHRVVFALQAPAPRAVVLVSKSGEENFHWIWTLEPAGQAGQAPAIVVSIQSQYWVFSSQSAWLTLCFLPHTETRFSLQLPEGAPEFLGVSRVVLAAALGFPFVREVLGIELLPSLHAAAEAAAAKLLGRSSSTAPLRLVCGDFLDWSDATVVFAMSLCFPEEMMQALEAKFQLLKPGSYVILMHCFMGTEAAPSCLEPISPQHVVRLETLILRRVGSGGFDNTKWDCHL
eukprot:g13564.t1